MRTISDHMTKTIHSIGREQPLSRAHELMRELRIRHLPVLEGGKLVGLVSQRDLHLIETLSDVDPSKVPVEEAMMPSPYLVGPDAPVLEVVRVMTRRKIGSAVVMQGERVVGVFTTIDALRLLGDLLEAEAGDKRGEARDEAGDEPRVRAKAPRTASRPARPKSAGARTAR